MGLKCSGRRCPLWLCVGHMAVALVLLATTGCDAYETWIDSSNTLPASPENIERFTRFSGIPIPENATVQGMVEHSFQDRYMAIVFEIPEDQVDDLVKAAGFTQPLEASAFADSVEIDGVELPDSNVPHKRVHDNNQPTDGPSVSRSLGVYFEGDHVTVVATAFTT